MHAITPQQRLKRPCHHSIDAPPRAAPKWLPLSSLLPTLLLAPVAHGEFAMNFSGTQDSAVIHGGSGITGQTPMTPIGAAAGGESVIDPSNGKAYWHYVVGDPSSGFAEEVYILKGGSCYGGQGVCSASGGLEDLGAGQDPLGKLGTATGSGSGNPNSVLVRMVLGGSWNAGTSTWTCDTAFCSEFIKSSYDNKPKITQGINDGALSSTFILDMSGIALSNSAATLTVTDAATGATGASLTNAMTISGVGSFDMARDSQLTHVNGGQYSFTAGSGRGGSSGTYSYVDGSYNPEAVDYTVFFDKTVGNPWAYPTNQP